MKTDRSGLVVSRYVAFICVCGCLPSNTRAFGVESHCLLMQDRHPRQTSKTDIHHETCRPICLCLLAWFDGMLILVFIHTVWREPDQASHLKTSVVQEEASTDRRYSTRRKTWMKTKERLQELGSVRFLCRSSSLSFPLFVLLHRGDPCRLLFFLLHLNVVFLFWQWWISFSLCVPSLLFLSLSLPPSPGFFILSSTLPLFVFSVLFLFLFSSFICPVSCIQSWIQSLVASECTFRPHFCSASFSSLSFIISSLWCFSSPLRFSFFFLFFSFALPSDEFPAICLPSLHLLLLLSAPSSFVALVALTFFYSLLFPSVAFSFPAS